MLGPTARINQDGFGNKEDIMVTTILAVLLILLLNGIDVTAAGKLRITSKPSKQK